MFISKSSIGHVLAPWPFLIFGILMIVGCAVACPAVGAGRGEMIAFDVAAITFLLSCAPLFRHGPREMRRLAEMNDANRGILLLLAAVVIGVIMTAIGNELSQKGRPRPADVLLVILTLSFCWLFSTVVYALHYAHLFYTRSSEGKDSAGLHFPETGEPDYWDFVYFSSCLAMTFQTSDVEITSRVHRRTSISHVRRICLQYRGNRLLDQHPR
jgi:uncharacterized membrane protein